MTRFSILPKYNPQQMLRLRRLLLAALASLTVIAFMVALYLGGYLEGAGLKWSTTGMLTCIVVFFAAIRSGWNLKLPDPSMTAIQMVSAFFVITSSGFFISSDARATLLPILLIIYYFGIYRFDTRAMTMIALINIIFYGALIVALMVFRPYALDPTLELLRWSVLALASLWFGTVGGYVTRLRRDLALRKASIEALLERDDLTGIGNRRFLMHMLEQEKSRAERTSTTFCVAMLDLDHFKNVNDTYGHAAGDKMLKAFVQVAQQDLRKIDYFGRYGGEEFLLIMSDTRLNGACATAERLRSSVAAARFNDIDPKLIQTVSIGIAEFRRGESVDQIQLRADKAMYKAKANGRNRVEVDDAPPPFAAVPTRPPRVA